VQVVATIDEELEVIEPGAELAELLAGFAQRPTRQSTNSLCGSTRQM